MQLLRYMFFLRMVAPDPDCGVGYSNYRNLIQSA